MAQPEKVALPAEAASGSVAQVRCAPLVPVPLVIDRPMLSVLPAMMLPPASATATTGWAPNATPPLPSSGAVVNTNDAGEPALTSNALLGEDIRLSVGSMA